MEELTGILLKFENLVVVVAVGVFISSIRRTFPTFFKRPSLVRILPILPLVLCSLAMWVPWVGGPEDAGARVLLGCVLGATTGQAHKMLKQTGFGGGKAAK